MNPASDLSAALKALSAGRDLTEGEAERAISEALTTDNPVPVAALLAVLRVKGETAEELAGAVKAVRDRANVEGLRLSLPGLLDTCGTGGDGARSVNVSTAAAVVVAACGVRVAKHGNRSASGNSGSAEVLAELGITIDAEPGVLNRCMAELGITFLFAPRFHPGLRGLAPLRKQLPFRTVFNLIGPLANPARPDFQLIGVAGSTEAALVAGALARLGSTRAAVVTGADGTDEVSLAGPTRVLVVDRGDVSPTTWSPDDFGLGPVPLDALRVTGPSESAVRINGMLAGEPGAVRDTVLANAAAALWVVGESDLMKAVQRATIAIDSGAAARLLDSWRRVSGGMSSR